VTDRVLLLTPSRGLGGGIERYAATVEWVLRSKGLAHRRMDLQGSGPKAYATLFVAAQNYLRGDSSPTRLILAHRALLPLATILRRKRDVEGISVLFHGSDVWDRRRGLRQLAESRAMRHPDVRAVAVSNYTAGALSHIRHATVVPPGLSGDWYQMLVEARRGRGDQGHLTVVTAFRLTAWKEKGLPEIVNAIASLNRTGLSLVICGTGEAPRELRALLCRYPFCHLRVGLSDSELASQLAAADIFVLATRMRGGRKPCGEGYGMVLQEAQLAGAPVVAPAYGGSHEAFVEGLTGVAPVDEKAETLADVLRDLLDDTKRLAQMSDDAAEWAYQRLFPPRYAELVLNRLL
jgi:phosphatidylinositol alpha-1,6-mannosyltransferase